MIYKKDTGVQTCVGTKLSSFTRELILIVRGFVI